LVLHKCVTIGVSLSGAEGNWKGAVLSCNPWQWPHWRNFCWGWQYCTEWGLDSMLKRWN